MCRGARSCLGSSFGILGRMDTTVVYLLYGDDGATLLYAGTDGGRYEQLRASHAQHYAGSLVGRRRTGRREQWVVRTLFRAPPAAAFIAQRRQGFPYGLAWEAAGTEEAAVEAADGG